MTTLRMMMNGWVMYLMMITCMVNVNANTPMKEDLGGGTDADINEFQKFSFVIGTLAINPDTGRWTPVHKCGATLIQRYSPILLITAAHCVKPIKGDGGGWTDYRNSNEYYAFRGWNGPGGEDQYTNVDFRAYEIDQVYFPEAWRLSNKPIFADVAIVRVNGGEDGRYFFNIPLPTPVFAGQVLNDPNNPNKPQGTFPEHITGWGKEGGDGEYALTVQRGTVHHITQDQCDKMISGYKQWLSTGGSQSQYETWVDQTIVDWENGDIADGQILEELTTHHYNTYGSSGHWVFRDEICAMDITEGDTSNCYGDSGGPLVFTNPQRYDLHTLMGVTSSSVVGNCSPKTPVMYSSLEFYADWIKGMHACIMLDRINYWQWFQYSPYEQELEQNHWRYMTEFWNEKEFWRAAWRANQNVGSELDFKMWYVTYTLPYRTVMQEWCDYRFSIENELIDNADGTGVSNLPTKPGFFPSMVEFSEWINQGREEKYRRAWAKPFIIGENPDWWRQLYMPLGGLYTAEANLAVSFDYYAYAAEDYLFEGRFLVHMGSVMQVQFISQNKIRFIVGQNNDIACEVMGIIPGVFFHFEFVLDHRSSNVRMFIDGNEISGCTQSIQWRPTAEKEFHFAFQYGDGTASSSLHVYATNIEIRTWTDPPPCCSDWNRYSYADPCMPGC